MKMLLNKLFKNFLEMDFLDKLTNKINGFGYISSDHLWDAKKVIAFHIVKTLQAYKKFVMSESFYSIPTWMLEDMEDMDSISEDVLKNRWLSCLDEMILGFQLENNYPIDMSLEERLKIQKHSLYLFNKYYFHLWD